MRKIGELSHSEQLDIIDMYINYTPIPKIVDKYDISKNAMYRLLQNNNISLHGVKKKIKPDEYDNIIKLYCNRVSCNDIAKQYNVHVDTIKVLLRGLGVSAKDKSGQYDGCKDDIINLYISGLSSCQIAEKYNTTSTTILSWLDKWGISRRSSKYHVNEYYFDMIDDQNKAYLIGLLYADGYNNVKNNSVSITLQERDRHILESFNELIESDRPLRFVNNSKKNKNWSDCYQLMITNEHLSKTLEAYGMVQAKSLVLEFPHWLDKKLYPHFLRGYLDGDGSIDKDLAGGGVSLVGTKSFCKDVQEFLLHDLNVESKMYIPKKSKNTIELRINKKRDSKIFLDYIYQDAILFLKRKFNTYQFKYCNTHNVNNTLTV